MASVGDDALAWLTAQGIKIAQRPKDTDFARFFIEAWRPLDNLVEIGVNHGGSLFFLGNYVRPGGRIVGIDPLDGKTHVRDGAREDVEAVAEELRRRGREVTILKQRSADALPTVREMFCDGTAEEEDGIDYLHIDGSHDYPDVKADFEGYSPLVRHGGAIQMHDIHNTKFGARRAWREIVGSFPFALTARHVGILPVHRG